MPMDDRDLVERDLEREPRRPFRRHADGLYAPIPPDRPPPEIRAGQFWAAVREHRQPVPHGWLRTYSYLVYDDSRRTSADAHSGIVAVVWLPSGSPYSSAASSATTEVARRHYDQRRALLGKQKGACS